MRNFNMRFMIPFCFFAIILVSTTPAEAAKINNKSARTGTNTSSLFSTQVAELNTTIKLLQAADHDYQGHRAQAVHDIHQAIHALHPTANNNKSSAKGKQVTAKGKNLAKGQGANKEPQAVSDAQLKQAIVQLNTVQGQLKAGPPSALNSVQAAVKQLQIALTIK
jgi:hypothetical protein